MTMKTTKTTETVKNVKNLEPGDVVIDRQWHGARYYDDRYDDDYTLLESAHYTYTVERPVPPLPLGTIAEMRSGTRYVKTTDDRWTRLGNGVISLPVLDNETVLKALEYTPPGCTDTNAKIVTV